jgi:hypothetical protein
LVWHFKRCCFFQNGTNQKRFNIRYGTEKKINENVQVFLKLLSHFIPVGDPGVGKSTLVHYLKNDPGPQQLPLFEKEDPAPFSVSSTNNHHYTHTTSDEEKNNLALGYSFVDVKDEEHEGITKKKEKKKRLVILKSIV